jgi:hypothetical protein
MIEAGDVISYHEVRDIRCDISTGRVLCYDTGIAALAQGGSEGQKWETTTTNHSLRTEM